MLAVPLVAAGGVLAAQALGLGTPGIEMAIPTLWARVLLLATGALLLADGGRMLLRAVLPGAREPQTGAGQRAAQRRLRLVSRIRMLEWVAILAVLTVALPLQGFHIVRGLGLFLLLMTIAILLLGFLSVTGSLMGSGSLDMGAAQWVIPQRTLEKLEAGAGLRGRATIDAMHDTGWSVNDNPQVHFELTVTLTGRESYSTRVTEIVPLLALGAVRRGASVPVMVDADAPHYVLIAWNEV